MKKWVSGISAILIILIACRLEILVVNCRAVQLFLVPPSIAFTIQVVCSSFLLMIAGVVNSYGIEIRGNLKALWLIWAIFFVQYTIVPILPDIVEEVDHPIFLQYMVLLTQSKLVIYILSFLVGMTVKNMRVGSKGRYKE